MHIGSTTRTIASRAAATASTGPSGIIPGPLWFVLLFIAVVIFAYALFFADSGERAKSQAMLIGSVSPCSRRCSC